MKDLYISQSRSSPLKFHFLWTSLAYCPFSKNDISIGITSVLATPKPMQRLLLDLRSSAAFHNQSQRHTRQKCADDSQELWRRFQADAPVGRRPKVHRPVNWRYISRLLKDYFRDVSAGNFLCKLFNFRSPKTLKFSKITTLIPFSTATLDYTHLPWARSFPAQASRFETAYNTQELGQLPMDLIPLDERGQLFISPSIDDWQPIENHGITAVIDLDGDLDLGIPNVPNHMLYVYFPVYDEGLPDLNKLHALAGLGAHLVASGEKVLVHCGMGLNRSALVAGLVLTYLGMKGADAIALLREKRPGALFNENFAKYLAALPPYPSGPVPAEEEAVARLP